MGKARTLIKAWHPEKYDHLILKEAMERLEECGEVVADAARNKLKANIQGGPNLKISRPVTKSGDNPGAEWTARTPGSLLSTIRVVRKHGDLDPSELAELIGRNVYVMAGTKKVYYARIYEFYRPFMRPALEESKALMMSIMNRGNKVVG